MEIRWKGRALPLLVVGLITALGTVLVAAPDAGATVTMTSVRTPLYTMDNSYGLSGTGLSVSGTSDGTSGDLLNLLCYYDTGGGAGTFDRTLASNVAVQADGSWTATFPYSTSWDNDACTMHAIPTADGEPTSGLGSYAGQTAVFNYSDVIESDNRIVNFNVHTYGTAGGSQYSAMGDCGLAGTYTNESSESGSEYYPEDLFFCNDWQYGLTAMSGGAAITVDGIPAMAPSISESTTGDQSYEAMTFGASVDDAGNVTIDETEPLSFCVDSSTGEVDTTLATAESSCDTSTSAGVTLDRTITTAANNQITTISDSWESTDGGTHAIALVLNNQQFVNGTTLKFAVPGQSGPATYSNTTVAVPAGSGAILVDAANTGLPHGVIAYSGLSDLRFSSTSEYFDALASGTATPSTPFTQTLAYGHSTSPTVVEGLVPEVEDLASPPSVAITSPPDGAAASSTDATISGTASAGSGVSSVTVDGVAATLADPGATSTTWSQDVSLAPGNSSFVATVTSAAGGTATSGAIGISYSPPPSSSSSSSSGGSSSSSSSGGSTVTTSAASLTPTAPQVTTSAAPVYVTLSSHASTLSGSTTKIDVKCPKGTCSGTLKLEVPKIVHVVETKKVKGKKVKVTVAKTELVVVGQKTYKLKKSGSVTVSLSATEVKAIKAAKNKSVAITVEDIADGKTKKLGTVTVAVPTKKK